MFTFPQLYGIKKCSDFHTFFYFLEKNFVNTGRTLESQSVNILKYLCLKLGQTKKVEFLKAERLENWFGCQH